MTPQTADHAEPDLLALPAFADASAALRPLTQVAALQAALLALLLAGAFLTAAQPGRTPVLDTLLQRGDAGLVGAALVLSLTGTFACMLLVWGRRRTVLPRLAPKPAVPPRFFLRRWLSRRRRAPLAPVVRMAGWPQAVLVLLGAALSALLLYRFPPLPPAVTAVPIDWPGVAGLMLLPAFLMMACERVVTAMAARLPESARLAALLRLPALILLVLAGLGAAQGFGVPPLAWASRLLQLFLYVAAAELALRTLAVWFLPLPLPERAQAAIGSAVAALLQPGALRPSGMAQRLRTQLGIDISRSWAVDYVRNAAPPVLLLLLLVSWGLSGVTLIDIGQRASYERFGAPVAILRPGLHMLLPWPFGRVRRVEYGVVHAVPVGTDLTGVAAPIDISTADGEPPQSANRLWTDQPGADTSYLIASSIGTRQSFETVSVDVRVLYRVGLDDESARRALYGNADPDTLVRSLAARLMAQFFADRTLNQVLGERREQVANQLRSALQAELDHRRSGLDVVALVVESMHPPGGAAQAYRSVQAAQITATTREAEETGRATGTINVAQRDAHDARDQADALAAELISAAQVDRIQAEADAQAFRNGGRAFLLERYFNNLRMALPYAQLEVVDNRLQHQSTPMIDLRGAMPPMPAAPQDGTQPQ